MKLIKGAGGGGKSGGGASLVPSEAADSLQSKAYANILDLISEGEIEGLVAGLQSIYLDGTPIQNPDESYNFSGITIVTRNGTQDQTYIPGFPDVESESVVSQEVKYNFPVVKTISDPTISAVRIGISIPQLTYQNPTTGDLGGSTVQYAIDLQSNGGGYQEVINDVIIGKCVSKYEKKFRVELTGDPPWDIRVRRITADSSSVALQNKTIFDTYTTIIDAKLRYPNSALVGVKIDASQFNSIPTRGYHIRGIRVKVPVNYNPVTRAYTNTWDGRFYIAWTNNPAWIFYDLITSSRYGLGAFIPESSVDKWALYSIAKYCDEMVPDGKGSYEPRFTCNTYIQTREEAFKVVQDFASCFRAMAFWANGTLTTVQDSPSDPAYIFNQSNVVDGIFIYAGSSAKTRHTVALVAWNDPEDQYKQKIEYVEDSAGIAKYGVIETQIVAFGSTSRGQAHRVGKWLLFTEQNQSETVTFKTGLEGATCRPGQIIKVADPTRAGTRLGGRIIASTTNSLTLDQSFSIDPNDYKITVILPNGTTEERALLTASGKDVSVATPFSSAPAKGALYILSSTEVEPQLFKIISAAESEDGTYSVTALAHNPGKYDFIENNLTLQPRSITSLDVTPDAPIGLTITETLYQVNAEVRVKVTVSWNAVQGASSYIVQYTKDNQNSVTLPATSSNDVEILNAEDGIYTVSVWAVNPLGTKSQPATLTQKIFGKFIAPADVSGFSLIPMNGSAFLSWNKSTDLNVLIGGTVRIRWSPLTTGALWKDAVDIVQGLAGGSTNVMAPLIAGTYLAKFVSSSFVASDNQAAIVTTIPAPVALNVVQTVTEDPAFSGSKTNMEYSASLGGIVLSAGLLIDSVTDNVDDIVNFDFAGGVIDSGSYDFAGTVDLLAAFTSRVTAYIKAEALDVADTIDQRAMPVDEWIDLDGEFIDDVNAELWMKTTTDDPSSLGAVWTDWKKFFVGDYLARGFKFQLRATSASQEHNIVVKQLRVVVDMPDRIFNQSYTSGASSFNVVYDTPFMVAPSVGITAKNMNSGDYYQITSETKTGFTITFYNSSNVAISRNFTVYAKGYGLQQ